MLKKLLKVLVGLYIAFLIFLVSAWAVWHVMSDGPRLPKRVAESILTLAEFPSKTFHLLRSGTIDDRKIFNDADQTESGQRNFSLENHFSLLSSTFSQNDSVEIKIVNVSDFKVKKRWSVSEETILRSHNYTNQNIPIRLFHPLLLHDSSLIFSSDALFKLNKNNSIAWVNNSRVFHHAIEAQGDSLIWTGSRIYGNKYFNFGRDTLENDAICAVDIESGRIRSEKSVADILAENGYIYLLQVGKHEPDLIHLNDIQPVENDSKYWGKGDLFISLRHRNTVFLYRPSLNKVIWLKTGPWLTQHDVDVVDDKTIMIFGNDVVRGKYNDHLVNGHNDIYFYDFEKDSVYRPYTKIMKKLNIATKTQGRCDLLPNGDLFIDESNNGKLYIITPDSLKMKYVERIDDKHIKMFNWVRPILN